MLASVFTSVALLATFGSSKPITTIQAASDCGQVRVDAQNTQFSGFIAALLDTERRYVITKTTSETRLEVKFENNTLLNQNGDGKYPAVGATFGFYWDTPPGSPNFAAGAQNYAYFNSVAATKLGDKPAQIPASFNEVGTNPTTGGKRDAPSESAIFYLDSTTGELTSKWVNNDGSFVDSIFIVNTARRLNISGDLKRYLEEWEGSPARLFCQKAA